MTILAGSAGKTPRSRPVDWIKDLAKFDPPDRDLSVGGTEGRQPVYILGSANFPWRGSDHTGDRAD